MAPSVEHMTPKQRRWWFAHLDDEKSGQGSPTAPAHRKTYLTEGQRRGIEVRKDYARGRQHGWVYVSGKKIEYQPRQTFETAHEQGFKEGVTEAKEWVKGMGGLAEMLGDMAQKAWGALSKVNPFRDFLKPPDFPVSPGTVRHTRPSRKGDLKHYSKEELARRLDTTAGNLHRNIKKAMKKEFRNEMTKIDNPDNPEILVDRAGNVWLQNIKTRRAFNTGRPLEFFKKTGEK